MNAARSTSRPPTAASRSSRTLGRRLQTVVIEHTEVAQSLAGRGVGRLLVEAAVEWARRSGTKFVPVCAYAKTVFERYPGLRDVLS